MPPTVSCFGECGITLWSRRQLAIHYHKKPECRQALLKAQAVMQQRTPLTPSAPLALQNRLPLADANPLAPVAQDPPEAASAMHYPCHTAAGEYAYSTVSARPIMHNVCEPHIG